MVSRLKKLISNPHIREMFFYVLFGGLTTLVNWVVYFISAALLRPEQYAGTAAEALLLNAINILAWVLSVLFAYVTNKRYVFQSKEKKAGAVREFFLFLSARVMSYLLFDLLFYNALVFGAQMDHRWVKILMNVLVVVFNYFASKLVIFKKSTSK